MKGVAGSNMQVIKGGLTGAASFLAHESKVQANEALRALGGKLTGRKGLSGASA